VTGPRPGQPGRRPTALRIAIWVVVGVVAVVLIVLGLIGIAVKGA
jgi:hypothetical protein